MLEDVESARELCDVYRATLRELTQLHFSIDPLLREINPDEEPDLACRLRKVGFHTLMIVRWKFAGAEEIHIIASELRAAFTQMDVIWRSLPKNSKLEGLNNWWARQTRSELLATYDHPTPLSLALPPAHGGLEGDADPKSYLQLAYWLGYLGLGYAHAIESLAKVLDASENVESRLAEVHAMTERHWNRLPNIDPGSDQPRSA